MSASFVSARRGWVLQLVRTCARPLCGAHLAGTADGGATWRPLHAVGAIAPEPGPSVRFADPAHGFVTDGVQLLATTDGGAHWRRLAVPFQHIETIEIARGVLYVVASGRVINSGFRVWSTPAPRIRWHMDPLAVPVGAGPVPYQQFAFANGSGWLIDDDRLVLAGARLTSAHRWQAWTPPCLHVGGPAQITASTPRDLVALCGEHIWTGPPPITTGVYFSHDGGITFHRHTAPADGLVASPSPDVAVIAAGTQLLRTTDQGATWHVVVRAGQPGGDSPVQLGFTTPTQGFVITRSGGMYLTRDAGATWSRVHAP